MFARSYRQATDRYRAAITDVANNRIDLANTDFDTGRPARHGEYALADDTYAELLAKLDHRAFAQVPQELRRNILAFYGSRPAPKTRHEGKHWENVQRRLAALSDPLHPAAN